MDIFSLFLFVVVGVFFPGSKKHAEQCSVPVCVGSFRLCLVGGGGWYFERVPFTRLNGYKESENER